MALKATVVGAGFAGLAAADALHRAGAEVTVFEARDRVGGRVWSVPFAGATAERGAEFILPGNETVIALAERLGLRLVRKGTLYGDREPRGGQPVTREQVRDALARINNAPARISGAHTVADALARYELSAAVAEAIRARIEVSCAHPANELAASALLEGAAAFGDFDTFTVDGGNDRIARALAAGLGDAVRRSAPVTRVAWSNGEVRVTAGDEQCRADAAVIALPVIAMAPVVFDPPLGADKPKVMYGQAAKLFVALKAPAPPSQTLSVPERFWCYTQLGGDGEPLPFVAAFAGTRGALNALEVERGPQRWLAALGRLRPDLELDPETAVLSTWHDDPWARGAYSAELATWPIDTAGWTRPAGPLFFAGEHTAGEWHGLMEGALRSGMRAAQELLQAVQR